MWTLNALIQLEGPEGHREVPIHEFYTGPGRTVRAAVTIGGNLAGPLGMLLGVPAASAAYALMKEATDLREQRTFQEVKNNESA